MTSVAVRGQTRYYGSMPFAGNPNKLRANEAARVLELPVHRVYLLVKAGRLKRHRDGGYTLGYYRREEVEALKRELDAERTS